MIYVVTYTTKRGHIGFCTSRHAHARHTTKYEAERTLKEALEPTSMHSRYGHKDLTLREFKNMTEACEWKNSATA